MPAQGRMISSPASDQWWSGFHNEHGQDSEEEKAFLGYLSTHEIPAGSSPDVLGEAYVACVAFIEESYGRGAVDEGKARVFAEMTPEERPRVPRSSLADPVVHEKSMTAATRHPDLREKESAKAPAAHAAPEAHAAPAAHTTPAPEATPAHAARRGRGDE